MKFTQHAQLIPLTLFAAIALAIPVRLSAQEQQEDKKEPHRYTVIDLGTLRGTFGEANAVNNKGWVVGDATLPGDTAKHAFLSRKGLMTDLDTLGGPNSLATSLNESGEITGFSDTSATDPLGEQFCFSMFGDSNICLPFLWRDGVMTPLRTLGGDNGIASGINHRGQVVGVAENTTPDPTCPSPPAPPFFSVLESKPVVWERGEIQELPTIAGDLDGSAVAINDEGQAVGQTGNCTTTFHAVLWQRDEVESQNADGRGHWTVINLGNLGGLLLAPFDINNRGQIVGSAFSPDGSTLLAFLSQNGVARNLGTLPPDVFSLALGINDKGQIVGDSCDVSFSCRAFLWQNGTMTELNSLVHDPNAPFLENANSINSRGQIVGKTTVQSTPIADAFLAIPCDEEHAGDEVCADSAEGTNAVRGETSQRPRVVLPENVRKLLQRRLNPRFHFPGVKAGPTN